MLEIQFRKLAWASLLMVFAAPTCVARHQIFSGSKKIASQWELCVTAKKAIPAGVQQTVAGQNFSAFHFSFTAPGASGGVFLDGKKIMAVEDEQNLALIVDVAAGRHKIELRLDKPATLTAIFTHDDIELCQ